MGSQRASLNLELDASPSSVTAARHAVAEVAEPLGCDVGAVRIAVSEIVGNAVMHAYEGTQAGPIILLARVVRDRFVVTIADRGTGMRPRLDSPGLGVGIAVTTKVASDLRVHSDDDGTVVSMSFELADPPGADGDRAPTQEPAPWDDEAEAEIERARELIRRGGARRRLTPCVARTREGGRASPRPRAPSS